jgi:hypothetical protein
METMKLLVEDEFYPEIMAFLEPFIQDGMIEILDNVLEVEEKQSEDICLNSEEI